MQNGKVLIVEDDPTFQFVTQRTLQHLGYETVVASSGEEAVALDLDDVLLVLMDIGLPGIDGRLTAMLIRDAESKKGLRRIPIVALTAHSDESQCVSAGMDDFLRKPAMMSDVDQMLLKYIEPSDSRQ